MSERQIMRSVHQWLLIHLSFWILLLFIVVVQVMSAVDGTTVKKSPQNKRFFRFG
uniref:Hypotheticial protein n=1 Tax=Schistosoma japonicum TaxID=6182 RepID=C7TXU9_SCHJA|nr:hypotheticial protein [Schistosoma japonicum]